MKRNRDIEKQVRQLLYSYKFSGFRRWTVTALAAVVVFCAVYNLILPAAAITGNIAREMPGIELGTESGSEGLDAVRTDEMETLSESAEEQSEIPAVGQTSTGGWEEIPEQQGNESGSAAAVTAEETSGQTEEDGEVQEDTTGQQGITSDSGEDGSKPEQTAISTDETTETGQTATDAEATTEPGQTSETAEEITATEQSTESDEEVIPDTSSDESESMSEDDQPHTADSSAYTSGALKFEDDDYTVELTYEADAGIPENAFLCVKELVPDSEEYRSHYDTAEGNLDADKEIREARFFDITIKVKDENGEEKEVEPQSAVKVSISFDPVEVRKEDSVEALHFSDENSAEILDEVDVDERGDGACGVSFNTESFSVFGVVVAEKIETKVIDANGETWSIRVTYGPEAGIPKGAELEAREILRKESGGDETTEYDQYLERAADALGWTDKPVINARFFDISIMADGEKIQPADGSTVSVEIHLDDRNSSDGTKIVHFSDADAAGETLENVKVSIPESSTDVADGSNEAETNVPAEAPEGTFGDGVSENSGLSFEFETAGFSVYGIVDAPEAAGIKIVSDLEELSNNTGEAFYLSIKNLSTYFSSELNNNNCFIETGDYNSAAAWHFEPAGQGDNTYYIYTGTEDDKRYIRNRSGNLVDLVGSGGTVFEVSRADDGLFYLKKKDENKWLQHSNGGKGIRFYTDNNDAPNSQITLTYVTSYTIPDDPYSLDGKTYGIAYHNNSAAAALISETKDANHLVAMNVLMKPDVRDNDGILLVSADSDISEWTFHCVNEDTYRITTMVNGSEKYLTLNGQSLTLADTPDEEGLSDFKVIPGTGENSGKLSFTVNGYSIAPELSGNNADKGFRGYTNTGNKWLNLVEKTSLSEDDFKLYTAKKVSVSDTTNVPDGAEVIIYTRIWNDTKKKYEFFAVDHDGSLIPCYDTGDNIEWTGTQVNTALWKLTEGHNKDGSLSYYYWLENTQYSGDYLVPKITADQIIYHTTQTEDFDASVNLNGRRYGENYTTVIAWDEDNYAFSSLKTENRHILPGALSESSDFYFAIMNPVEPAEKTSEVGTIDSTQYGISMKMIDFNNRIVKDRDEVQQEFFGWRETKRHDPGLLSTDLDANGYPKTTSLVGSEREGHPLSELFNDMKPVNNLFLSSIYNESGYFEYDSTQNFAHLITGMDDEWYDQLKPGGGTYQIGDFVVYDQIAAIGTQTGPTRTHGQFMPYNDIHEGQYAHDTSGKSITNQTDVLAQELPDTDPRKGEQLYSIPQADADYFYGMELSASFTQTANGLDAWGHDIIFEFSGDDDFWLYVDGELVLDLGGIRPALAGSVNFRTGEVISAGTRTTLYEVFRKNYQTRGMSEEEINTRLGEIFTRNESGQYVFKDYSTHTMRMFYMERGAGASNLHMRFNLASVKPGTVVLSKKLSGAASPSNGLLQFPYQIYYKSRNDGEAKWHRLGENEGEEGLVTYKDSTRIVEYKQSVSLDGITYENVFFLKPGESAVIDLPDDTVGYKIVECGVNTDAYDRVRANEDTLTGTPTAKQNRKNYETAEATVEERPQVDFDNHVAEGAMRTLSIKKKLYDVNGTDLLHYDAEEEKEDKTVFNFRLFLGNEFTSEDDIPPANLYPYYVKNRADQYCRWDASVKRFVSLGISDYARLSALLETLTEAQRETIEFRTSSSGSISKIPADYTVEVRDLIIGTHWKAEEWDEEIPKGYTLRLDDGYTRVDVDPEQKSGTTPIHDTMESGDTPKVEVRNQKGWGLTVDKIWTDKDFMELHDTIYFAVYQETTEIVENEDGTQTVNTTYTLLKDTVRQMLTSEDSLYYYFGNLQSGVPFENYKVFEVILTGDIVVDSNGYVTSYDSIERVEEGGNLTIGGKPAGGEYHPASYTAAYERGEQTTQNENVRTDKVTNSRPGIKLFKTDWAGNELSGAVFTLKDAQGSDVAKASYSSDSTGLITIAYLNAETYTLTETAAPGGYLVLDSPLAITVAEDGTISASGVGEDFFTVAQATETEMARITIKDRNTGLQVKKVDAATKVAIQGVHFALYPQVKDASGNPRKDYIPKPGYEDLVTNENGILETVNMENLDAGTYYLTETQSAEDYDMLTEDLCFTLGTDGTVSIVSGGDSSWLVREDEGTGKASYILSIPNSKMKKVSIWKTDTGYTAISTGASFELYMAKDYDDSAGRIKAGASPVAYGTTGPNGLLALGSLASGEYRLVETSAPAGYIPLDSAVKIFVYADRVAASQGTGNSEVYIKGDPRWVAGQDDDTWQIRVWNSAGVELPSTGGIGTRIFTILGVLMILGAGVMLFSRRRA